MDWHPETEHHLQEIIKLLLGIPEPDLPEFRQDPYDNGMRISLDRQLKAGRTGNELLLHVLAGMDGKELNNFRERNGKKWRWAHTTRFLKQHEGDTSLHFTYHPYTGRTGDISQDWTLVYNGITPMGHLTVFFTEEERDASLYDEDTGARWPENEIWACETQEALFHILRAKQRNPEEQESAPRGLRLR